jgi:hypothetical protein
MTPLVIRTLAGGQTHGSEYQVDPSYELDDLQRIVNAALEAGVPARVVLQDGRVVDLPLTGVLRIAVGDRDVLDLANEA